MKKITGTFFIFIKKYKIAFIVTILLLVIIVGYIYKNSSDNTGQSEIFVTKSSISEIVSVTGNVRPLSGVDLAFERGGRIATLSVDVGDKVLLGQSLASIANADLVANLNQAQANLKKALAQYQDIKIGTRPEEIILQKTQIEKAEQDLVQAKIFLVNTLKDSFTKADDAVKNKMYSLFNDPTKYYAGLSFYTDSFLQEDIVDGKNEVEDSLYLWYRSLKKLDNTSDLENYYIEAKENLNTIKVLLDKCAIAVNGLTIASGYVTQNQIDAWKSNISSARSSTDLAISTLTSAYDAHKTTLLALKISENQLAIKEAGSTSGAILSAEASYEIAEAGVASANAELAKSIIRSPIAGIITKLDVKLGEIVSANKAIISVISYGDYEVESFITEADISKIKIGDMASTTLDAYGSSVNFETTVIKIDPAATVIDGVPTYKVTLKFTAQDDRIRSGMTANLDILTNQKNNVLILPSRVIANRDGEKYVSTIDPEDKNKIIEKKIITGLRGSDGNVEIISGLSEGQIIVLPVK